MDDRSHEAGRRGGLECMLWAGPGVLWTVVGGVPRSRLLGSAAAAETGGALSFVHTSDSQQSAAARRGAGV